MKRRDAMKTGASAAACAWAGTKALAQADETPRENADGAEKPKGKPLRVLILGGTGFIGPHFVEALRAGGHTLALFNRGKSKPSLFPGITTLTGDRNGDVEALKTGEWDAVIDNSGYLPKQVRLTAELLKGRAPYYLFISSISAYADWKAPGIDEEYPLAQLAEPDTENIGRHYGPLKAACEKVVADIYGSECALIRPTYIVGPGDTTERFTYWPARVARGGAMLAPGHADDPMQFIDVRDLADFVRLCVEQKITGPFNACNRPRSATIGSVLQTSKETAKADTEFVWVSREFLAEHRLSPSAALPLYTDPQGPASGSALVSSARAEAKGLRFRELKSTIADTLAWHRQRPAAEQQPKAWLGAEREAELLALWKKEPR